MHWAAEHEGAKPSQQQQQQQLEIYNVDNGDVVSWEALFKVVGVQSCC
jgi:hypothetical protein